MKSLSQLERVIGKIDPNTVGSFLITQGYERRNNQDNRFDIYESSSSQYLILPLDKSKPNYSRRILEILETFVDDECNIDDIIGRIVLPASDIIRYKVETPDTAWGHLRLSYGYDAIQALYDVFLFSAAGYATQRLDYRGVPESAKLFAKQCRFGQTEYGSFVLKIFCPLNPSGVRSENKEPFGRGSTLSVVENIAFLASEDSENPEEPLPPTMNRQVANAVQRLKPYESLGTSAAMHINFSKSKSTEILISPLTDDATTLDFGPFIYSRAKGISDRLKKAEEFQHEILKGYIVNLHKDRPKSNEHQSHEVTIDVKYGTNFRQLRARLLPSQYRNAIKWHETDTPVLVDAVIDTRSKVWSVFQLNKISASEIQGEAQTLFE